VHVREHGVVARTEAELPPRAGLTVARPADRIDVASGMDQGELVVGGIAGEPLDDVPTVDDAVVMDQLAGEDHPGRSQRMLRAQVVPRGVVAVPDQLHALAHDVGFLPRDTGMLTSAPARDVRDESGHC
jgi:hypothetical protein